MKSSVSEPGQRKINNRVQSSGEEDTIYTMPTKVKIHFQLCAIFLASLADERFTDKRSKWRQRPMPLNF